MLRAVSTFVSFLSNGATMPLNYHEKLAQLHAVSGAAGLSGADEAEALARFARFFADFSPNKIGVLLDQTYAQDAWFNDTLKTIEGREALRTYLRHSAEAVESCTVEVKEHLQNARGDYFVRWVMKIRFKKFKKGQDTETIGMSHLRFNQAGLVCFHQDYWDATAGIFEHIPVLGWMIAKIKARL
jgi:hypothetical protein